MWFPAVFIAVILIALILRGWVMVNRQLPVHDEAITLLQASGNGSFYDTIPPYAGNWLPVTTWYNLNHASPKSINDIARGLRDHDIHPPLYFIALSYWLELTGVHSLAAACFFNLPIFLLGALALFFLSRKFGLTKWGALFAVVLWSFSPASVDVGCQARPYCAMTTMTVTLVLFLVYWRESGRKIWLLAIALLALLMGLTNYTLVLLGPVAGAAFLVIGPRKKAAVGFAVTALSSIFSFLLVHPTGAKSFSSIGQIPNDALLLLSRAITSLVVLTRSGTFEFLFLPLKTALPLAVLITTGLMAGAIYCLRNKSLCPVGTVFLAFFCIQVGFWLVGIYPASAMGNRYLSLFVPFGALCVAAALDKPETASWRRNIAIFLLLLILPLSFLSAVKMMQRQNGVFEYEKQLLAPCSHVILDDPRRGMLLPMLDIFPKSAFLYSDIPGNMVENFQEPENPTCVCLIHNRRENWAPPDFSKTVIRSIMAPLLEKGVKVLPHSQILSPLHPYYQVYLMTLKFPLPTPQ